MNVFRVAGIQFVVPRCIVEYCCLVGTEITYGLALAKNELIVKNSEELVKSASELKILLIFRFIKI